MYADDDLDGLRMAGTAVIEGIDHKGGKRKEGDTHMESLTTTTSMSMRQVSVRSSCFFHMSFSPGNRVVESRRKMSGTVSDRRLRCLVGSVSATRRGEMEPTSNARCVTLPVIVDAVGRSDAVDLHECAVADVEG
jgi:hypothetical protein